MQILTQLRDMSNGDKFQWYYTLNALDFTEYYKLYAHKNPNISNYTTYRKNIRQEKLIDHGGLRVM